jgi:hypothetical protein
MTALALVLTVRPHAQGDLDTFMRQVVERRDLNWRKLQQYVLDEHEQTEMRGPSGMPLWGERRDFTWYIRDGFFIRSPLRVNSVTVSESDRRKYEAEYLAQEQQREARSSSGGVNSGQAPAPDADVPPSDVDGLIRQSRRPRFVSSAYFLRFTFDAGRYALVGREQLEGLEVLRIEYYPDRLFTDRRGRDRRDGRDGRQRSDRSRDSDVDAELRRLMNKASKVTLWIEPASQQILKYTFDDLGWNFFPAQWLAQMDGVTASMTMTQAFPEVWLPRSMDVNVRMLMAFGNVELRYSLLYDNYRQPDVRSTIGIPDRP